MTNTSMTRRIANALRSGDQAELDAMASDVDNLMIIDEEKAAWLDLIEAAMEAIDLQSAA